MGTHIDPFAPSRHILDAYVNGGQYAGATVAVVHAEKEEPIFKYVTGWGGEKDGKDCGQWGEKALHRIYSMTKPITSVAAMMLIEGKSMALDDEIWKYIPEFKSPQVIIEGKNGDFSLVPAKSEITVRHLLTHTSGFGYGGLFHTGPSVKFYEEQGIKTFDQQLGQSSKDVAMALAKIPLLYHPGECIHYSLSTDVLGYLVEVVSGMALRDFMLEKILKPLKMNDTDFWVPPEKMSRLRPVFWKGDAFSHVETPNPTQKDCHTRGVGKMSPSTAGGAGLFSTCADYIRFMRMLLNKGTLDGVRILSEESVEIMTEKNHLPEGKDCNAMRVPTQFGTFPGEKGVGWCLLGTILLEDGVDKAVGCKMSTPGEYGWGGYASTYFQLDPKHKTGFVVLTQLIPSSSYPVRPQMKYAVNAALKGMRAELRALGIEV
mmetsp:Transcript_10969/g.20163  ORF Transcript_10969/g.20163 Transcript_10969/m.20163 type:complete len:431 (+) Transcript_10969:30-1322(+)